MQFGVFNKSHPITNLGIKDAGAVAYNYRTHDLMREAIARGEGELGQGGALLVTTGQFTGRTPKDKFTVEEPSTQNTMWWNENNSKMSIEGFNALKDDMFSHLKGRDLFVQDLYAGADESSCVNIRQIHEYAWHNLFIRHLLRRPERDELESYIPHYTLVNAPSFKANPERHNCRTETVIAVSFEQKLILIAGTAYAGENKKAVFGLLNYLLPEKGIMPMHCSANHAIDDSQDTSVFFGLSGTGKTTLSADPSRILLGDDEHGWSDDTTFNFEGGCYAKTISLSPQAEPEIYKTTKRFGTIIENMVYDPYTKELDFDDDSITANMRCAYPLEAISNASPTGVAGSPKNIVMLTCDAFGVLPPVARLTPGQAMYHFLSGFTSKIAGTELGVSEPQPTFSTCYGAPFMPRRPEEYGALLRDKISTSGAHCWLVNTGWTGGGYGTGERMPIKVTRAVLTAAIDGTFNKGSFHKDPYFGFDVPSSCLGVDDILFTPRETWHDKSAYDDAAKKLVNMFVENFLKYEAHVNEDVKEQALKRA